MKKILHLTLKKKWFDLIASGEKKTEYREIKEHWDKRFLIEIDCNKVERKKFDEIYFKNGYKETDPFMRVEWLGLDQEEFNGELHYAIRLGTVLEVKRFPKGGNKN